VFVIAFLVHEQLLKVHSLHKNAFGLLLFFCCIVGAVSRLSFIHCMLGAGVLMKQFYVTMWRSWNNTKAPSYHHMGPSIHPYSGMQCNFCSIFIDSRRLYIYMYMLHFHCGCNIVDPLPLCAPTSQESL